MKLCTIMRSPSYNYTSNNDSVVNRMFTTTITRLKMTPVHFILTKLGGQCCNRAIRERSD